MPPAADNGGDNGEKRKVAIKLFNRPPPKHSSRDPKKMTSDQRERHFACVVGQHPNLMRLISVFATDNADEKEKATT